MVASKGPLPRADDAGEAGSVAVELNDIGRARGLVQVVDVLRDDGVSLPRRASSARADARVGLHLRKRAGQFVEERPDLVGVRMKGIERGVLEGRVLGPQMPPALRKSGMPLSTEMPAPVTAMTTSASRRTSAAWARESMAVLIRRGR
jgi:hypothetical protein